MRSVPLKLIRGGQIFLPVGFRLIGHSLGREGVSGCQV
jgi:hypothetical protein